MSYININVPTFPYFSHSGNAIYRPGDKHPTRKGIRWFDLIVVEYGSLSLNINGTEYNLPQYGVVIIPPDTPHYGSKRCKEKTYFHWLHFSTTEEYSISESSSKANAIHTTNEHGRKQEHAISLPQYQILDEIQGENIVHLMTQLETCSVNFFHGNEFVNFVSETNFLLAQEYLMRLLNHLSVNISTPDANNISYAAMQYFNSYYADSISLDTVAKAINCHPSHLIRCMKQQYGTTPMKILNSIRLEKALQAIQRDTTKSITELAYSCGFSSTAYFCKQFKEKYGVSPLSYRKTRINN